MNRLHRGHLRSVKATTALLAAVAVMSMAGCSGADKPSTKASGPKPSAGSAGTAPGTLKDESAAVLSWKAPTPVAKAEGQLEVLVEKRNAPATAEIISVRASDTSTILVWQLSAPTDIPTQGNSLSSAEGNGFFPNGVRLVDPVAKKSYGVNRMSESASNYCVCSAYPLHVGPDPVRMTASYPALPAGVTSVSVRIPKFAPVTVAVTR